jgi:predicted nucleotidyltransferase component of viral defense system
MMTLQKHEIFEIEVLEKLKKSGLLEPLVFGGGTMLRLCHELPRFSVDLDLWFLKETDTNKYFEQLQGALAQYYEITDAAMKFHTLLIEVRSSVYPRRLKIEIRREPKPCDWEVKIAFSRFAIKQVQLRAHTLAQCLSNKIEALQSRDEIRDAFDLEFLLRRGAVLPPLPPETSAALMEKISSFKEKDFKVTLGSVLEKQLRDYYNQNRFSFAIEKLRFIDYKGLHT